MTEKANEASPILHNSSSNEKSNENVDDDDDELPEVRFEESFSSTPSVTNKPSTKTSTSNTNSDSLSPPTATASSKGQKLITGNYQTVLNFKEKFAKYNEYVKYKKETDEAIKRGGFQFDKNAQLISKTEDDLEVELDQQQLELLKRWNSNPDPLIPLKPELDKLFNISYDSQNFKHYLNILYKYPNDFNAKLFDSNTNNNFLNKVFNGNIHQICEKNLFLKYYNQVATNDNEKVLLLNHLFYYATCFMNDFKILIAAETLASIFIENKFSNINWKISAAMLLQVYTNFGLDLTEFQTKFSKLFENIEKNPDNSRFCIRLKHEKDSSSSNGVNSEEKTLFTMFDLIMNKLLDILLLSIKKRSFLYKENELDFIFLLLIYTSLDENYERLNARLQTKHILNEIIDAYNEDIWKKKKIELCQNILVLTSKHHHRTVFINMYFELTRSKRVKELSFQLAYSCALKLLFEEDDVNLDSEVVLNNDELCNLLNILNEKCVDIYSKCSYKMFSLVRCLDLIFVEIMNEYDKDQVNKFVIEFKAKLTLIRRSVRDRLEYEGRHQVKVILTNLISKCDYYLNEHDRKKLTLSNVIFDKNNQNDSLIENKDSQQENNDKTNSEPEPMSLNESNVVCENRTSLDATLSNTSFLPSIE